MQKPRKYGRPKKPVRERETFGISAYFTEYEFIELKHKAQRQQYKSLSKFLKDTLKIGLRGNVEIQRSIDNERQSYRAYAGALSDEIDEIIIQSQNLEIPHETIDSINKMIDVIEKLTARLNQ